MSSQEGQKVWTFVPERSRVPPNRRATKRQTTVRAFTFVRDWDPRVSPLPILHNASQKETSNIPGIQSASSQSSLDSVRESPIAQLVRSSPGPIIISKRSHGNKSFRSPPPRSESSQRSVRRSPRKNIHSTPTDELPTSSTTSHEETGVSPSFPLTQSRQRHSSGSTTRSPVSKASHSDSIKSVKSAVGSVDPSLILNTEQQDASSPGRGQRSRSTEGQSPAGEATTASNSVQSKFSTRTHYGSGSSDRTKSRPRSASRAANSNSTSEQTGSQSSTTSTRRRGGGSNQPIRKRTAGGSISKLPLESQNVSPQTQTTRHLDASSSSDSTHSDIISSNRAIARIQAQQQPSQSSSSDVSLEDTVRIQKSRQHGARGAVNGSHVSDETPANKGRIKPSAKTPADKSMSLIAVTPKSGHVTRPQTRITATDVLQTKGKRGPVMSGTNSSEEHEEEEPREKRAKVRLWTTGARPRLVSDTTDLDIILNRVEDTAADFKEALDVPGHKRAVTEFVIHARKELTDMISLQQDFKFQNSVVLRTKASIRRYRKELLNLQKKNARVDAEIAELKRNKLPDNSRTEDKKDINQFLGDLQAVHENYAKKYPEDMQSLDFGSPHNVTAAVSRLTSSCCAVANLRSLNDKLQEWIDIH